LRLTVLFVIAAAACSPLAWLSMQAVLNPENADGAASAVTRSDDQRPLDGARLANQTSAKILALDEARRRAFWTFVLKSRKQRCDAVVRASYAGGTSSGLNHWTVRCLDGNQYTISVEPNAKDSVCVGNAFDRSAAWGRM
jgi:hypothetical protein